MARIRDLYVYPVKSLRGVRVSALHVDRDGPRFDRQWMLVDARGMFISQRSHPDLARIEVHLTERLTLTHDRTSVDVAFDECVGSEMEVRVHGEPMGAVEVSARVSAWFAAFLGPGVRLVRWREGEHRAFADDADLGVRFVDQKPLLVISTASLVDLNHRVGRELEMIRFRPNVVIEGVSPYAEDGWEKVRVGDQDYRWLKPCSRCKITTVDPITGEVGPEPLRTLMTYRRSPKGVVFGSYYAHNGTGILREGAEVFSFPRASV